MTSLRALRLSFAAVFLFIAASWVSAQQTQTWLLLNSGSQETLFATDPAEQMRLVKAGWKINGTGFLLSKPQTGTVGVQRLAKGATAGNDRIFAVTPEQVEAAVSAGYTNEGTLGQVSATQTAPAMVPVYHFTKESRNMWLIDKKDQPWAEKAGWKLEGTAFWIWPKTTP